MKKLLFTILFLTFVISSLLAQTPCWDGTVAESYDGGNGTISDPFQIASAEQLALLAQQTNSGLVGIYHYVLTNDICLGGSDGLTWTPIGTQKEFTGTFDGDGHSIYDMRVTDTSVIDAGGLFGYTGNATIKNLIIHSSSLENVSYAGMIAGWAENTNIIDCTVSGSISYEGDTGTRIGGIAGTYDIFYSTASTKTIKNCVSDVTIQTSCSGGSGQNGGLAGFVYLTVGFSTNLVIENCVNFGDITAGKYVGGIVGDLDIYRNKGFIRNCNNYGKITSTNGCAGGIVGEASDRCFIENCVNHSTGEVTGWIIGGIMGDAGYYSDARISRCVNNAPITGDTTSNGLRLAGGIAGYANSISNCYNTGDVSVVNCTSPYFKGVGGIAGEIYPSGECHNVYNTGNVNASEHPKMHCGIMIGAIKSEIPCYNMYWLGDYDIPVCGDSLIPENSCAFRPGATPTSWVLDEPQFGTTDLVQALNYGSNYECTWLEDVDFTNNGLPIFVDYEDTFPFLGTEWYYEITNANGSVTYQYLECAADTTIGTTRPKVIVKSNTLYDKDLHTKVTHEYVYSEDGIVYWWDKQSQSYTTLYNFNANIDDEWTINVGNQSITVHVNGINNIEHNGEIYRVLTINDADDIFSGEIICGIGHTTSFFPEELLNNRDFDVDGMRCYWLNGEQLLQFGDIDCDEIYNIYNNVVENEESGFEVYPNPANEIITINIDNSAEFTITNICGQIVMRGVISNENQQIDVENLDNGIYFLNINNQVVKIIKN